MQNFGSWSPYMVKEGRTCLGLEFFVNEGDDMWTKADDDLVEQGKRELAVPRPGRRRPRSRRATSCGCRRRIPCTTTHYKDERRRDARLARGEHAQRVPVGRNGMHKYNNQDHSMFTAMLSVENILGADHDVWAVNVEEEYHEEHEDATIERGPTATRNEACGRAVECRPRLPR